MTELEIKDLENKMIMDRLVEQEDDIVLRATYPNEILNFTRAQLKKWNRNEVCSLRVHAEILMTFVDADGTYHIFRGGQ